MTDERREAAESQLHRWLSDAYSRGADHQRDGRVPEGYELRVAKAEAWARDYLYIRRDRILALLEEEPVGRPGLAKWRESAPIAASLNERADGHCRTCGQPDPGVMWVCFHCGIEFTEDDYEAAVEHFGRRSGDLERPTCVGPALQESEG